MRSINHKMMIQNLYLNLPTIHTSSNPYQTVPEIQFKLILDKSSKTKFTTIMNISFKTSN